MKTWSHSVLLHKDLVYLSRTRPFEDSVLSACNASFADFSGSKILASNPEMSENASLKIPIVASKNLVLQRIAVNNFFFEDN